MRPSKWVLYAPVALLPFLAALVLQGQGLQQDLSQRVLANLKAAGASWAGAEISGRDVILRGDSPAEDDLAKAVAAVSGTYGVRLVTNRARVVPPAAPASGG